MNARPTTRAPLDHSRRRFLALAPLLFARSAAADPAPVDTAALAARGLAELERWAHAQKAELSASIVELGSGREIAACASNKPLNPASCQKILTIAAALDRLGPGHRFFAALHGQRSGDSLDQLVLRSDGHPELTTADLLLLVERLTARGIRRVRGDVLVDQSAFDSIWDPPAYEQRPNDWATYRAPVSAVAIDGNTVTLNVQPGAEGERASAWLEPPGIGRVDGTILTTAAGKRETVGLTILPGAGTLIARVSGTVPGARLPLAYARRLANPEAAPAHVLRALLERAGVSVTGKAAAGGAGVQSELGRVESRPLAQIVHALGKRSDNFCAEMLLKAIGRNAKTAGSSSAGAAAIENFLRARGLWSPGTKILNGSGLYDADRVSALTLARALQLAHSEPRIGPELVSALSIGGVDGTLSQRFAIEATQRRMRAKTGTLATVIALAGYLFTARPVAFAILLNDVKNQGEAKRAIDAALGPLLAAGA